MNISADLLLSVPATWSASSFPWARQMLELVIAYHSDLSNTGLGRITSVVIAHVMELHIRLVK